MNEKNKLKVTVYLTNSEYEFVSRMKKLRLFQVVLVKSLEKRHEWLSLRLGDVFTLAVPDKESKKFKRYTIQLKVDSKENKGILSFLKSLNSGEASLVFKGAIKYLMDMTLEEIISGFKEHYTEEKKAKLIENQKVSFTEPKVESKEKVQEDSSKTFVLNSIPDFKVTNSNKPKEDNEKDIKPITDEKKLVVNDDMVIDIRGLFGGSG